MKKGIELIQYNSTSRRHFLKSSSGFCLTLPFLESLFNPGIAKAAPNGARRFIFLHNGHGQVPEFWFPTTDPAFTLKGNGSYNSAPLSSIVGNTSSTIGAEFNSLKSKINLLRGIDFLGDGASNHTPEACLMSGKGQGGGLTADHVIAQYLSTAYGRQISSTVIHNGFDKESSSYGESGKVVGETNAKNFFASLFGVNPTVNSDTSQAPTQTAVNTQAILQRKQKSVDVVKEQVKFLMQDPRLSSADKKAMDEHLQFLSEMEGKIFGIQEGTQGADAAVIPSGCTTPELPAYSSVSNFDENLTLFLDTIVLAAKCNKAPVINFMMHPYDHGNYDLQAEIGFGGSPHTDIGHGSGESTLKMHQYYAKKVARLLSSLDAVADPEGGGSLLDTSVVYWGNDMGASVDGQHHITSQLPVVIAGGANGLINQGQYLDYSFKTRQGYSDKNQTPIRPHNQLLISIMLAMGMTETDWGSPGSGFGQYHGNDDDDRISSYGGSHKSNPLPGLLMSSV